VRAVVSTTVFTATPLLLSSSESFFTLRPASRMKKSSSGSAEVDSVTKRLGNSTQCNNRIVAPFFFAKSTATSTA